MGYDCRVASSFFLRGREFGLSEISRNLDSETCPTCAAADTGSCSKTSGQIRCGRCLHGLTKPQTPFLSDLPNHHARSVFNMDEFLGRKNVSILEFVNPSDFHFLSVQLEDLDAVGEGDWVGGDSWFDGESERISLEIVLLFSFILFCLLLTSPVWVNFLDCVCHKFNPSIHASSYFSSYHLLSCISVNQDVHPELHWVARGSHKC